MKLEIRCWERTERIWNLAKEMNPNLGEMDKKDAAYQMCDFCYIEKGIGFIWFTEDGKCKCLACETIELFK